MKALEICWAVGWASGLLLKSVHNAAMYASPNSAVNAPAVLPEIIPPTTVPAPGINLSIFATRILPPTVPPLPAIAPDSNVPRNALVTCNPNTALIPASILTCVGTKPKASEKRDWCCPYSYCSCGCSTNNYMRTIDFSSKRYFLCSREGISYTIRNNLNSQLHKFF